MYSDLHFSQTNIACTSKIDFADFVISSPSKKYKKLSKQEPPCLIYSSAVFKFFFVDAIC